MPYDKVLQENIEFTEMEKKIISLAEFKRLEFIKQNGFAYTVYPYATHNRLDHSIGTMYWVTHLYDSINGATPSKETTNLQALRLAALVHDIGHGPFSHALEILFDRNPELMKLSPWKGFIDKFGYKRPHELLTLNFIESEIFTKTIKKKMSREVAKILKMQSPLSLLISGDLDADRLDYLTRDSHHSGLPFGLNVKAIFNELLQKLQIVPEDSEYFLQIDSRGNSAFEQLLMARYAHYFYIAYDPKILSANLIFVSAIEESLWGNLKRKQIALALFYIFTTLTDSKLLDWDFSDVDRDKKALLGKLKTPSTLEKFKDLKNFNRTLFQGTDFIRLSTLGREVSYNFFKKRTIDIKRMEAIVSRNLGQPIKMYFCLPHALTTRTRINDPDIAKSYGPSLAYDYSPVVRALEQKMYFDCGIVVLSDEPILQDKLTKSLCSIPTEKTDFDTYTYAVLNYIQAVRKKVRKNEQKWKLRRMSIFDFLKDLNSSIKRGSIKEQIDFKLRWYSPKSYELLQKLEFLDALTEDFNLSERGGLIPCYLYSRGEYAKELIDLLKLKKEEKEEINQIIEKHLKEAIP